MKSFKILSLLFLTISLSFLSCTDENNTQYNKGDQPLEISSSKEDLVLDANNPESEAVKFTWTSGTNYGTGLAIDYTFEMDIKGGNFENGVVINIGRNIFQQAFKNEEFNNLVLEKFGLSPDTEAVIQYRIKAKVADEAIAEEISPVGNLDIKTHLPISNTLYIVGSAAPKGWDASLATPLNLVSNATKSFSWTGALNAGEFKLITTLGEFIPSYNKGDELSNTDEERVYRMVLRQSDTESDDKFEITEGGTYNLQVNLITKAIVITKKEGPEYSQLWFVGNPTGWSFQEMTVDPSDPFVFHYNADLSDGGEFKIGANNNFEPSTVFLRPEVNETPEGTGLKVVKWAGEPDNKWKINGGVYKIKLDTKEMLIDIVPYTVYPTIYMIGDASPAGWTIDNATPMNTESTYISTWTGNLNTGELKFTLDKKSDWGGDWFVASKDGIAPSGEVEQMIYSKGGANPDNKWKITEAGAYTIQIDQLKETVIIKKQ